MKFKVGDKVAWRSQSGGVWKEKHGEVIEVLPPNTWQSAYHPGRIMFDGGPRNHESYIVEVREGKRKPKLYWPVVSKLERD
jgi:hypothetical protein